MPPMSWTSKWRWPSVRLAASRTVAEASGGMSSTVSPWPRRSLSAAVRARRSSSESAASAGSTALISSTSGCRLLMYRSFAEPNTRRARAPIIKTSRCSGRKVNRRDDRVTDRDIDGQCQFTTARNRAPRRARRFPCYRRSEGLYQRPALRPGAVQQARADGGSGGEEVAGAGEAQDHAGRLYSAPAQKAGDGQEAARAL